VAISNELPLKAAQQNASANLKCLWVGPQGTNDCTGQIPKLTTNWAELQNLWRFIPIMGGEH